MSEPIITFDKVNKWYGNNFHVLRDIDRRLPKASASSSVGRPAPASPRLFAASTGWRNTSAGELWSAARN